MNATDGWTPADPLDLQVTAEFLALVYSDREAGRLRPLVEYQGLFPGHEGLVAREYAELDAAPDSQLEEAVEAGIQLGRFQVQGSLGRGGQARVYRAIESDGGRVVALKVLELAHGADLGARLRLECEASALARLDHPGLVRVIGIEHVRQGPILVMELVEGENLAARIAGLRGSGRASDWPLDERLALVEVLARALHAAHERGVLHRDVKPSNVIVRPDGTPVLVDFGLALVEGIPRVTRPGGRVGTPAYLPPERLRGERAFDRRGDVYMLGALLHECLTLRAPFEAPSQLLLQEQILNRAPQDIRRLDPTLPASLSAVVATALAKEPADRYVSALALAEDLARVRRGEPVSLSPLRLGRRLSRFFRRRPRLALVIGLCLGVTAGGALLTGALARAAQRALAQVERDIAVREAVQLEQEARTADWPELPQHLAAMDEWLARAEPVGHALARERVPEPALREARRRLEAVLGAARERRARAAARAAEPSDGPGWETIRAAVAASPLYGGLALEPQPGLVPLGRDARSGLFEFAHPRTGRVPTRDSTGRLTIDGESALVFVLLPGGTFWMGAEPPDASRGASHNADPQATDSGEWPAHIDSVGPFFLSKYEMTQGQWLRVTGENPSRWQPGSDAHDPITLAHPVENVGWSQAERVLRRLGLELPSEAQWEYAARAGSETPWSCGSDGLALAGHANLLDLDAVRAGEFPLAVALPGLADGHVEHAPVGSFLPNAFGLHDVHGNVWEHCADLWRYYPGHPRAGECATLVAGDEPHVLRGGGYGDSAWHCRSSRRDFASPTDSTFSRGVRPARTLEVPVRVSSRGTGER